MRASESMKICIIDNHTKHLSELAVCFSDVPEVVRKEDFDKNFEAKAYDLIVLSGGSGMPTVMRHADCYDKEIELVKNGNIPIIGICLGAEIIIKAFGGGLKELNQRQAGLREIDLRDQSLKELFPDGHIDVFESHAIGTDSLPPGLSECASSKAGVEIFRHTGKKIIGIQFHPEVTHDKILIKWILDSFKL